MSSAYYDEYLIKRATEKTAAFLEERFLEADSVEFRRITRLKDGVVIKESRRRGKQLLGTWFAISGKETLYMAELRSACIRCERYGKKYRPPVFRLQ